MPKRHGERQLAADRGQQAELIGTKNEAVSTVG
jgi:hypothetical protein